MVGSSTHRLEIMPLVGHVDPTPTPWVIYVVVYFDPTLVGQATLHTLEGQSQVICLSECNRDGTFRCILNKGVVTCNSREAWPKSADLCPLHIKFLCLASLRFNWLVNHCTWWWNFREATTYVIFVRDNVYCGLTSSCAPKRRRIAVLGVLFWTKVLERYIIMWRWFSVLRRAPRPYRKSAENFAAKPEKRSVQTSVSFLALIIMRQISPRALRWRRSWTIWTAEQSNPCRKSPKLTISSTLRNTSRVSV